MSSTANDNASRDDKSNGAPFASPKEMHTAMVEAAKKHGSWERDPAFMKRLNATPREIRTEV